MVTQSKITLGDQLRTLEAGIKANMSNVLTLVVGEVTYTVTELIAKIEALIQAQTDALNAKNDFHAAVAAEKTSNTAARVLRAQMHGYAVSRYGSTNPILSQFSFTPRKPKKTTAATKAVAALKVKATREARNTLGPVQKAKIKGSVDPAIAAALATKASAVSPVNVEPVPPKAHATEPAAAPAAAEPAPQASPAMAPAAGGHGGVS